MSVKAAKLKLLVWSVVVAWGSLEKERAERHRKQAKKSVPTER